MYLQEQGLLELQPGKKKENLQNYLNLLAQEPACEQSLSAIKKLGHVTSSHAICTHYEYIYLESVCSALPYRLVKLRCVNFTNEILTN